MLDEHDRDVEGITDLDDILHELGGLGGVHAGGGLVEQQQARVRGECAHDLQAALGTIRQAARLMVRQVLHVKDRQQLKRLLVRLGLATPVRRRAQDARERGVGLGVMQSDLDVLLHRHGVEQADVLERAGDAHAVDLVDGLAARIVAVEQNGAAGGSVHLSEQIEHRGLTRSVGTDESGNLGLANGEVEVVDRLEAAEIDAQVQGLENGSGIDVALRHDGVAGDRHHLSALEFELRHLPTPPLRTSCAWGKRAPPGS